MSEQMIPKDVEHEEFSNQYELHGIFKGAKGGDEKIGSFEIAQNDAGEEKQITFVPNNTERKPGSKNVILESTFTGVVHRMDMKDDHYYCLIFPAEKEHLYLSMMIGFNRPITKGKRERQVMAEMGRFGDQYHIWTLAEEQWQSLDNWLSQQMEKAINNQKE